VAQRTDLKDALEHAISSNPARSITGHLGLLIAGTTTIYHDNRPSELLRAGNRAELVVFESLPHGFWMNMVPEDIEAYHLMANSSRRHWIISFTRSGGPAKKHVQDGSRRTGNWVQLHVYPS
jgi:hypothetical protein